MSAFFSQVFSLLTSPPGNLVYELVLVFSIAGALQSALLHWRTNESSPTRRTVIGLGLLLGIQILLFALGSLTWGGRVSPAATLPVLDRAVAVISIIWITWLWAFPDTSSQGDAGAVLLSLMTVAAAALSIAVWSGRATSAAYNHTLDDLLWQAACILLIALGGFLLAVRRNPGYANGLALLAVLFIGHAAHLFLREDGSFSGVVRLAYIAAFPLLLTLPQRFASVAAPAGEPVASPQLEAKAEAKRYGADPKTSHALFSLAAESSSPRLNQAIVRAISHTMLADLCFLLTLDQSNNELAIASGYDLIREEYLPGTNLNRAAIPRITTAIQRGRAMRLPANGTSADIKGLSETFSLANPGSVLAAPIVTPEKETLGGVLLLSPYSQREWTGEDQVFLSSIAGALVHILRRGQTTGDMETANAELKQSLNAADDRIAASEKHAEDTARQLEALVFEAQQSVAQAAELESLKAAFEQSEQRLQEVEGELEAERSKSKASGSQMEQELNASLRDVAQLQNQLAAANQRMMDLEKGAGAGTGKREQAEVIASISQELRQPMSSIIGYTDLLLGESVGILGALQRKFVERIKASTDRLGSLIDDMIQLNTMEVGLSDLKPEAMDLNLIIDNALAYTGGQVREKKISMHLDVPKRVAPVNADREALQQILIHLLQNAGAATPVEGSIGLKVQTTHDEGQAYVHIQVTDSGGGIPQEDLPRVFTRLYRADNVLIQGVGDTGVGLSIAKTLTEAQHGRIWVESEPGAGATFNVLLPAVRDTVEPLPKRETT